MRRTRHALATATVGSMLLLVGGLATPSWAAEAPLKKYPGQVPCPPGDYQLCIEGGPGGFEISGRNFSGHANAIHLKNVKNVTIRNNTFKNLSGPKGFAGVHVKNSSGIVIHDNEFTNLRNEGYMHGVYLVQTSGSQITDNRFTSISGDPVRIRDGSSDNTVSGNTFRKSGTYALFSEWRDPSMGESCGTGNTFRDNQYKTGHGNSKFTLIKWGGTGSGKKLDWGHCPKASIVNKGGNKPL
ncbi:right-handed parallel beta-helix repeat-containing protein [Streptomyces sp. NBC_00868]|uniref:right-handed parallel beta-helix repeat-containing protein n=1 Tax=unclassified Streptomyces TaxID=2593676 RepID=UPI00324F2D42|nr:right-handed parallel beta-helix repeat-containing protein [Streptomyces sp. NBC_00868]